MVRVVTSYMFRTFNYSYKLIMFRNGGSMNMVSFVEDELKKNMDRDDRSSLVDFGEDKLLKLYDDFCIENKRKKIPDINIEMSLSVDLGLDSLNQVELLVFIERSLKNFN